MAAPYIPLYIDDLDAAIAHLSLVEEAIYMRLMKMAWRSINCSIVDDIDFISRKIRAEKRDIETILNEFFILKNGKWIQKRLKHEFDKYKNKISERKKAGKIGGLNNSLKNNNKKLDFATAKSSKPEPEPEPNIKTKAKRILLSRFEDLGLEEIPIGWLEFAIGEGLSNSQAKRQFEMFGDVWRGKGEAKKDWLATWRNRIRSQIDKYGLKPEGKPSKSITSLDEIRTALTRVDKGQAWRFEWFNMTEVQARQLIAPPKLEAVR